LCAPHLRDRYIPLTWQGFSLGLGEGQAAGGGDVPTSESLGSRILRKAL